MTDDFLDDLKHFTGSATWHRHGLNRDVWFTDGVKYVADRGCAYWLLDEIALAQRFETNVKVEDFQAWKLTVTGTRATLTCEDGNDRLVFTKTIEFTDFPKPGITLWFTGDVILLPNEY